MTPIRAMTDSEFIRYLQEQLPTLPYLEYQEIEERILAPKPATEATEEALDDLTNNISTLNGEIGDAISNADATEEAVLQTIETCASDVERALDSLKEALAD